MGLYWSNVSKQNKCFNFFFETQILKGNNVIKNLKYLDNYFINREKIPYLLYIPPGRSSLYLIWCYRLYKKEEGQQPQT